MRRQEASRLVAVLSAAFPGKQIHDETVAVYAKMLEDLDAGLAGDAVTACIKSIPRWPSVAEIRENYWVLLEQRRRNTPALPEPDISAEQRAVNLERVKAISSGIGT